MSEKRISGRRLQTVRKRHFQRDPLCVMCEAKGVVRLAQELDHIVALTNGGTNDPENFAGLCRECHIEKTRKDLGWKDKPTIGLDGWPEGFS